MTYLSFLPPPKTGPGLALLALLTFWVCAGLFGPAALAQGKAATWNFRSLKALGGYPVKVLGEPKVIAADKDGQAIAFDGQDDGLLLDVNPLAGATEFRIDVVLKPYDAYPENVEQRFLHIQHPADANRRLLLELRLTDGGQWFADYYLRTENGSLTLVDSTKTHPVDAWATVTMVYKNGQLTGYVNGVEQVSGKMEYLPISAAASTSVGTRMDRRSWFRGAIKTMRFSPKATVPSP